MAVRGVYSKAEEKMLARLNNSPFMKPVWFKEVSNMPAKSLAELDKRIQRLEDVHEIQNMMERSGTPTFTGYL